MNRKHCARTAQRRGRQTPVACGLPSGKVVEPFISTPLVVSGRHQPRAGPCRARRAPRSSAPPFPRHRAVKQRKSGGSLAQSTKRKEGEGGKDRPGREREGTRWRKTDGHRHLRRERVQGKGSNEWREANRRRQLQTATQPGVMPAPPPHHPSDHPELPQQRGTDGETPPPFGMMCWFRGQRAPRGLLAFLCRSTSC